MADSISVKVWRRVRTYQWRLDREHQYLFDGVNLQDTFFTLYRATGSETEKTHNDPNTHHP